MIITLKKHKQVVQELQNEIETLKSETQEWERFVNEDVKKMAKEAGDKITAWEQFFSDTLEDVDGVLRLTDELMKRRQVISDDPDVQNFCRIVAITHDILKNYVDAHNTGKIEYVERTDDKEGK